MTTKKGQLFLGEATKLVSSIEDLMHLKLDDMTRTLLTHQSMSRMTAAYYNGVAEGLERAREIAFPKSCPHTNRKKLDEVGTEQCLACGERLPMF